MTLPRLRAVVGADDRAVARLLRSALRHEVEVVPLAAKPASLGQHLLEVDVAGEGIVTLLADPAGAPTALGHPLHLRPVTRPQMASLFAMIERLDEPSKTVPPPPGDPYWDAGDNDGDGTIVNGPSEYPNAPSTLPPGVMFMDRAFSDVVGFRHSALPTEEPEPALAESPSVQAAPRDARVGREINGKYRIEAMIGSGSTAAVYRALHIDLKRQVAVKILHEQKLGQLQFVSRFKGEALAASRLEHPNVTRVIDFGQESDGLLYLVMELLEGRSLEAILAVSGRLPARTAVTLASQAASALAFAHDVGIVHRDVKPENIMVVSARDDDGNPCDVAKVCDFGLAKLRDPGPEQRELTTAGLLCGSPAYMSPEQTRGERIDTLTDIYSLGVTLYECLTGVLPHDADNLGELFLQIMTQVPRRPSTIVAGLDPALDDIVMRAIAIDPRSRQKTARVLRGELRTVLARLEEEDEEKRESILPE